MAAILVGSVANSPRSMYPNHMHAMQQCPHYQVALTLTLLIYFHWRQRRGLGK